MDGYLLNLPPVGQNRINDSRRSLFSFDFGSSRKRKVSTLSAAVPSASSSVISCSGESVISCGVADRRAQPSRSANRRANVVAPPSAQVVAPVSPPPPEKVAQSLNHRKASTKAKTGRQEKECEDEVIIISDVVRSGQPPPISKKKSSSKSSKGRGDKSTSGISSKAQQSSRTPPKKRDVSSSSQLDRKTKRARRENSDEENDIKPEKDDEVVLGSMPTGSDQTVNSKLKETKQRAALVASEIVRNVVLHHHQSDSSDAEPAKRRQDKGNSQTELEKDSRDDDMIDSKSHKSRKTPRSHPKKNHTASQFSQAAEKERRDPSKDEDQELEDEIQRAIEDQTRRKETDKQLKREAEEQSKQELEDHQMRRKRAKEINREKKRQIKREIDEQVKRAVEERIRRETEEEQARLLQAQSSRRRHRKSNRDKKRRRSVQVVPTGGIVPDLDSDIECLSLPHTRGKSQEDEDMVAVDIIDICSDVSSSHVQPTSAEELPVKKDSRKSKRSRPHVYINSSNSAQAVRSPLPQKQPSTPSPPDDDADDTMREEEGAKNIISPRVAVPSEAIETGSCKINEDTDTRRGPPVAANSLVPAEVFPQSDSETEVSSLAILSSYSLSPTAHLSSAMLVDDAQVKNEPELGNSVSNRIPAAEPPAATLISGPSDLILREGLEANNEVGLSSRAQVIASPSPDLEIPGPSRRITRAMAGKQPEKPAQSDEIKLEVELEQMPAPTAVIFIDEVAPKPEPEPDEGISHLPTTEETTSDDGERVNLIIDEQEEEYLQLQNADTTNVLCMPAEYAANSAKMMQPSILSGCEKDCPPGLRRNVNVVVDKLFGAGYLEMAPRTVLPTEMWEDRDAVYFVIRGDHITVKTGGCWYTYPGDEDATKYMFKKRLAVGSSVHIPKKTVFAFENWGLTTALLGFSEVIDPTAGVNVAAENAEAAEDHK